MTQPVAARPYASYTDAQLQQLIVDARGPARRQVQSEIDYRKANPGSGPGELPVLPSLTSSAEQVRQQFLADQAWSGLTPDQQQVVTAHADAQAALADATKALTAATASTSTAQRQFEAATTAVQTAAEKAQAVVAALPASQQESLAGAAAQVPQLVEQMAALSANVTQVATEAATAQTTLADAGQAVSAAVTQAVTAAVGPQNGTAGAQS